MDPKLRKNYMHKMKMDDSGKSFSNKIIDIINEDGSMREPLVPNTYKS